MVAIIANNKNFKIYFKVLNSYNLMLILSIIFLLFIFYFYIKDPFKYISVILMSEFFFSIFIIIMLFSTLFNLWVFLYVFSIFQFYTINFIFNFYICKQTNTIYLK